MKTNVVDKGYGQVLEVELEDGETVFAEPGAFVCSLGEVSIEAKTGDLGSALMRAVGGGESIFQSKITAVGKAKVVIAPPAPAAVERIQLDGEEYLLGDGVYLAHTGDITVSSKIGGLTSIIAGSGLAFLSAKGNGEVFVSGLGGIGKVQLKEGETFLLDNTNFVAVNSTAVIERIKLGASILSSIFTGEAFGFRIRGPATVYYQTGSGEGLFALIKKYLPRS